MSNSPIKNSLDSMKHYSTYQSQFIEMFYGRETTPAKEYLDDSYPGEWGSEDNDGSGVKVIRTTNFTNTGKLNLEDVVTRNIEERKVTRKQIRKFDTILERSGGTTDNPVGRVVLFEDEGLFLCNNFTQVLRFKDIDPRYAFYALYFFYQTNKTAIRSMGSKTTGIQNLNMSKYLEIGIPNATQDEQNEFVRIAEQADKSKFSNLKSQFIEMFGNYEMNANFGDLFSSASNGANIKQGTISGGIPITRIETISEGEINRDKMGYAGIVDNTYSSYYLQDGDILVSHINSMKHIGKCALYQRINDETIIHGMNLLCLRPYKDIVNPQYVTYLLRSSIMRKLILDITKPAVNQASFTVKDLCKLKVMLPPISEQEEFVAIVDQADKSKYIN